MKKRIRRYLRDARTRSFWRRFISMIACIVVFCTTYALLLPAITMEKTAACGFEEHQHVEECFEEKLTCGLEEGGEHTHTADCYTVEKHLVCKENEHVHNEDCYDPEGRLTCALREHSHNGGCYEMDRILSCGQEETKGHTHTAACYEKILTCGKQVHSHSPACYKQETAESGREESAKSQTKDSGREESAESQTTDSGREESAASWTTDSGREDDSSESRTTTDRVIEEPSESRELEEKTGPETAGTEATEFLYTEEAGQEEAGQEIALPDFLTPETSVWFRPAEADDYGWNRVDGRAEILQTDDIRLYYQYTIPAGALHPDHPETRLSLPENITLTDNQIEYINTAGDERGAQVINGTRLPNAAPQDEETVAAWFRIENHIDENENTDGMDNAGKTDFDIPAAESGSAFDVPAADGETTFEGPVGDIVLTFDDSVIEENRDHYEDGRLTRAGRDVSGFFSIDLSVDQIHFEKDTKETRITLVPADAASGTKENSAVLAMMDENGDSDTEGAEEGDKEGDTFQEADTFQEENTFQEGNVVEEQPEFAEEEHADTGEKTVKEEEQTEPGDDEAPDENQTEPGDEAAQDENQTEPGDEAAPEEGQSKSGDEAAPEEDQAEPGDGAAPEEGQTETSLSTLTFEGPDYTVTATFDQTAGIPADAALSVKEITQKEKDYKNYREQAEQAVGGDSPETVAWVRLFDISIVKDGQVVEPSGPVSVQINYHEAMERAANVDVKTVHFEGEKETPRVLNTETGGTATAVEQVSFDTDSFSVFAIVGTTIEKTVLASDGHNYKVTVTYGTEANLPQDADISVTELKQNNADFNRYLEESASKLGKEVDAISYVRIFDISLISKADPDVHYQPEADVAVSIELLDAEENRLDNFKVLHISDDDQVDVLDASADGNALNFMTGSFSIYPIVDDDTPGGNARIAYRFWYFNAASGAYEQMSAQYFRYSDVQERDAEIYEPSIPGMSQEDFVRIFQGWHKGTVDGSTADLSEQSVSVLELNQELKSKAENEYVEGTYIDLIAELKDAYYITYVDINTNNILSTDLVLKEEGETYFTVKEIVKPIKYEDKLMGWRLLEEIDDPDALLYEAGTQYPISSNITLAPVVAGGYWLIFDDNDLVDDGTGRMISGGASYTAPAFYMNTENEKQVTVQPEDPFRTGYAFGGWYEDEACTIPFSFGELLTKNTTVYAKWIPSDSAYRVIIWKQKSTDKVGIDDADKTYDYDTSYLIDSDVTTGELIYLDNQYANIYGENGISSDTDKGYFTYNPNKSDPYIVVKADGSSVINVYYDRVPMTMNFYTWGNGYIYTESTSENGTQYGLVNGEYVELIHEVGEDIYTYTYSPVFNSTTGDNGTQYGIVDGEYVELDKQSITTYRTYYIYNRTTGNSGTQYGVYNGEFVQLTRFNGRWYRTGTTSTYNGNRYTQTRNNNGAYSYTDTRYTRTGYNAPYTYSETTADSGTQYGVVTPDQGHVQLEKNTSGYAYFYNGEPYTGTRYTASVTPSTYIGQLYRKDGDVYHATDENGSGLYGRDQNNVFRVLNETHTPAKLWSYTDSDGVKHYYTGTRYTRSSSQQRSWQLYESFEGLYGSTLESNGYTWPTGYNWYNTGYNIANGGNANGGTAGNTAGSRMTLKTTFEPLDNSTTANFYGNTETTTGSAIIFYLQNLDGTYTEANRFYTGNNSGTFHINDKYTGYHAAYYRTGGSGNWTTVTPKGTDGYYGNSISFNNTFEVRFDRNEYTLTFFTNNGGNDVVDYTVLYENDISDYAEQAEGQKTGHYFLGWYADAGFSQPFDFNTTMPDHNVDVYGYWKMERIRVVIVPGANNVYTGSQALSFRLDYDEKISGSMLEAATRTGYILDGWYTDPEFTNKWIFSTPVNAAVEGVDMTYHTASKWASARVAYGDDDEDHDNVRGIIQLYAKWIVDTSQKGINVEYDSGEAGIYDTNGTLITTVPIDPQIYQEGSDVVVGSAPSGYNELYHFQYWEAIDSDGNVLEVTDKNGNKINQLPPGTTFNVDGVTPYSQTEDEDGNPVLKTIRLRAKYVKDTDVDGRYTTITYNGNSFYASVYPDGTEPMQGRASDGSEQIQVTYDEQINATIVLPGKDDFYLDGYELVGWSFIEGTYEDQMDPIKLEGNINFLPGQMVAADDLFQNRLNDENNILYAMWQPKTYKVTVKQVVENGVPVQNYNYNYKSGVENVLDSVAFSTVTLTGNDSVTYANLTADPSTQFQYYDRVGHVFNITAPAIPDNADYDVRVNATVLRDDGTRETLPLNELGNYEILGDVEITYTYSMKVSVTLEKRALDNDGSLSGSKFILTPVQWNAETSHWEQVGTTTFEYNMASVSTLTRRLQEGVYRVEETQAPSDYAMMGEPVLLTVRKGEVFLIRTIAGGAVSTSIAKLSGSDGHTLIVYDRPIIPLMIKKVVDGQELDNAGYTFSAQLTLEGSPMKGYDTVGNGTSADITNGAGIIEFKLGDNVTRTIYVPWGTVVEVTENEYAQFEVETSSQNDIADEDTENDRIYKSTVEQEDTITFTNRNMLLTVTKEVSGSADDQTKPFTFTLSGLSAGKIYRFIVADSHVTKTASSEGTVIFELKHGQTMTIPLTRDKQYTVTETEDPGFDTSVTVGNENPEDVSGKTVTLSTPRAILFTNTRKAIPVRIIKVDDKDTALEGAVFTLIDTEAESIEVADNGSSTVFDGELSIGGVYTLTEIEEPENYEKLKEAVTINVAQDGINVSGGDNSVTVTDPVRDGDPYIIHIRNTPLAELTVQKVWSCDDFVTTHGPIHVALYKESEQGVPEFVEGSVKKIVSSDTSVVYKVREADLADYVVREVVVNEETISPIDESGTIVISDETTKIGNDKEDTYVVTYSQGQVSEEGTVKKRTDTVTNTMRKLVVNKTDLDGSPLKNAVFTLLTEDKETAVTGYESITSSEAESGNLLNNTYLSNGVYYLKETASPAGYIAPEYLLKITVEQNGITMLTDTEYAPRNYSDQTTSDRLLFTFSVENNPGVVLPSTGGSGTTLIHLLGLLFVGLSGAGFLMKRTEP